MRKMRLWKKFFWILILSFLMIVVFPIIITGAMLYHYAEKATGFCDDTQKGDKIETIRLRAVDIGFDVIEFEMPDKTIVQVQSHLSPFFKNPCVLYTENGLVTKISSP